MALTTNKKNKIIADHKAGRFKSGTALAKYYKVDPKTVKKITAGISQENVEAVEAGIKYEMAKKSSKNPVEIKAIEKAVEERTAAERMIEVVLDNSLEISVHTTTASMKKLQDNAKAKAKDKMEAPELLDHQKLAKLARDTVTPKEKKETNIEFTQNNQQTNLNINEVSKAVADALPD